MIKPKTPEEVIAFIGSNYNSKIPTADPVMNESGEWVTGELLPLEDVVYSLTVHNLLGAFREWGDDDGMVIFCNKSISGNPDFAVGGNGKVGADAAVGGGGAGVTYGAGKLSDQLLSAFSEWSDES